MSDDTRQSLPHSPAWQALQAHREQVTEKPLHTLFSEYPDRAREFTLNTDNLLVDFSRQRIANDTLTLLHGLAEQQDVMAAIRNLVSGGKINSTENRPALHTALRSEDDELFVDGVNIMDGVREGLANMANLVEALQRGEIRGSTGKAFTTVINLGIGGSDLGPRLVVHALRPFHEGDLDVRFVANIDYEDLAGNLADAKPETTMFVLASKSFSTLETLTNARSAMAWLEAGGCDDTLRHFIGVTANRSGAEQFGIASDRVLEFGEWVGGRYSLWSTIGLPIALATGMENFARLLAGARAMDRHFTTAPMEENIPVTLGLIDVWNSNFLQAETLAVVPYEHGLTLLPDYLSQLMMESNGKNVTRDGQPVDYHTGLVVWGAAGTNAQHAFFQLLHQGTRLIPVDFLVGVHGNHNQHNHQRNLLANCLAQGEALMAGRDSAPGEPWRHFPGNKPSTTLLYNRLTPYVLGQLLALYEHRTFVQACLWNINAFDQWGVELGKELAKVIIDELETGQVSGEHDASTRQLIEHSLKSRGH